MVVAGDAAYLVQGFGWRSRLRRRGRSGATAAGPRGAWPIWLGRLRLSIRLAVLVGVGSSLGAAWAQGELFVTNARSNSVTVYARTAARNTAPLRTLSGSSTGLSAPEGLALDLVHNELMVANISNNSVAVYARGASGDTPPLRSIQGSATGLNRPFGLAVDLVHDELVVVNFNAPSVTVYARTADGNTAPLRTLSGGSTELDQPLGVALDLVHNELIVANVSSVTVYARTASGNALPLRTLAGPATGLRGPTGVAVDLVHDELVVANIENSVTVYPRTADGDTAPLRTLAGSTTGVTDPIGLAVDTVHDELVLANRGNSSVAVYARTASGDTAPLRTLIGASTRLNHPVFPAVTPSSGASVELDGSAFRTGGKITYQATLTESTPIQVDIYLGCLLPDGVTFLSLARSSPGVISITLGPSPVPFLAGVTITQTVVPFSFTFTGAEPRGMYFTFAGIAIAGSNPFVTSNQLALAIQAFQFTP